ncbi:MAG: hypothetical protein DCC68_13605 [Planctomycetota bacterium]|nr:MAG: hypothetical protein DCC68_13605 [Planctomycetota bacterium]
MAMQPLTVVQLDFLPASYRQQTARRRDRRWRAVIFVGGVLLLSGAWIYRVLDRRAAQHNFDILSAPHQTAVLNEKAWQAAKERLRRANLEADLITYLRHPWTTSQTLSAIAGPMPDTMRLTELKIVRETARNRDSAAPQVRNPAAPPDKAESQTPDPQRDLARLREEYDNQRVVVLLSGEALDGAAPYDYIRRLAASDVFVQAEVTSLQRETSAARKSTPLSQFQARAVVRPGIGQPGASEAAPKPQLARARVDASTEAPANRTAMSIR